MSTNFQHPGTRFEVLQKDNVPEIHIHVEASMPNNKQLKQRIILTTRKITKILSRYYDYNVQDLKTVKDDHVTNLNDNTKEERTGHWIFSLPVDSFEEKDVENLSHVIQDYIDNKLFKDDNIEIEEKKRLMTLTYSQLVEENKISISEVTNLLNTKIVKHPRDMNKYKTRYYLYNVANLLNCIDTLNETKKQRKKQSAKRSKNTKPTRRPRTQTKIGKASQKKTRIKKVQV